MIYVFSILDTVTHKTRALGIRNGKTVKETKKKIEVSLQFMGYSDYEIYLAPIPFNNIVVEYLRSISHWFGLITYHSMKRKK